MNFAFFFVGNLHILYVTDEDWDGQEYGCGLWNEVTKTFTKGSMTSLNIKGGWGRRSDHSKNQLISDLMVAKCGRQPDKINLT